MNEEVVQTDIKKSWKKTFAIIFTGQAFSILGSSIVQFALIWYLTEKTGSALVLTIATLVAILPQGLLGFFAGPLIDRYDRKKIMIIADLGIALATFIIVIWGFFGEISITMIMIVMAIRSVGSAFHSPALQASVPMFVPEEDLAKASGYSQAIQSISLIAGPALGALAISLIPLNIVCLIDVVGAIIASSMLFFVKIPNPEKKEAKNNMLKEMKEGIDVLLKNKGILLLTIGNIILMIMYMPVNSFFPLMSKVHFNGTAIHASIAEITFAVGMLAGGISLGIWGGTKKKIYTLVSAMCLIGIAIFVSGILPQTGFVIFAIMSAIMGIGAALGNGIFTTILQLKVDKDKQGRVFSIIVALAVLATPLGMLISGPVAEFFGITTWFIIAGIVILVVGIGMCFFKSVINIEEKDS